MHKPEHFMRLALAEASKAQGRTRPNPMVGAVIVKDDVVLAQGFHQRAGLPHAEVEALAKAPNAEGADLYVTLEPCNHQGRTGPCTEAVIAAKVKRVFVAMRDPNPNVVGHGIERLRAAGIEVHVGILEAEAQRLNEAFSYYIQYKMPFVAAKLAQSLDGKVATRTGESQWITSDAARALGHALRNTYDAILVGIGTVLADDPKLTCRVPNGRDPIRVIVDSQARTPLTAQVLTGTSSAPTWIAVSTEAPQVRVKALENAGAQVLVCDSQNGQALIKHLLKCLAEREVTSVLVEGGPRILGSFFDARLVNKVHAFIAPKIIGGSQAKSSVMGEGVGELAQAHNLHSVTWEPAGTDLHVTGYLPTDR